MHLILHCCLTKQERLKWISKRSETRIRDGGEICSGCVVYYSSDDYKDVRLTGVTMETPVDRSLLLGVTPVNERSCNAGEDAAFTCLYLSPMTLVIPVKELFCDKRASVID